MTMPSIVSTIGGRYSEGPGLWEFPVPPGGAVGDYVIATVAINADGAFTLTAPAPWVQLNATTLTGTLGSYFFVAPWSAGLDYSFTQSVEGRPSIRSSTLVRGARPVADWVKGPYTTRASLGTGTTTVAPSLTATFNETLVIGLFTERTTALETGITSVTGATEVAFYGDPATTLNIIETTEIVSKTLATTGLTTGTITVTYPNTQSTNGAVQLLGIPANNGPIVVHGPLYTMGSGIERELTLWTGTQEATVGIGISGYKDVEAMIATPNFAIAHRGGDEWVEHTMRAYTNSVFWGCGALEASVWRSSDGVWVCNHDSTTAAVFGTNLTISTSTWAQLSALRTTVGNHPMLKLVDLFAAYGSTHVIMIDNKSNQNVPECLDLMDSLGGPSRIIMKGFYTGVTAAGMARVRGYETWGYYYIPNGDDIATSNANWSLIGFDYFGTPTDWAKALAPGKPVIAHGVDTAAKRATAIANGASGIMAYSISEVVTRLFPADISLI